MTLAIVAHHDTDTNGALVAAGTALGVETHRLSPRRAVRRLGPGDIALGRIDVRETLDGVEEGMRELGALDTAGVVVLNPPATLITAHDKWLTARVLHRAGLPHPRTWLVEEGMPFLFPELPIVIKPRFGSWGRDVSLCRTQEEIEDTALRLAYHDGVIAQELVPPLGWDVRVVVGGGRIVGAARRIAALGEWRTNVSLGGRSVPFDPPEEACSLALLAADAVSGDLVGVDLLPKADGWVINEVNGAVDFRPWYGEDVYVRAVTQLLRVAASRRSVAASARFRPAAVR